MPTLAMLCISAPLLGITGCIAGKTAGDKPLSYDAVRRNIIVDGDASDWEGIKGNAVRGEKQLWIAEKELLIRKSWHGNEDHSFNWRSAWDGNRFYFLVEVTDDHVQPGPAEPFSWLNECVEIQIDPKNQEGQRITGVVAATPVEERIGKPINGYEMHFLFDSPPKVYLDDTKAVYRIEDDQNAMFADKWDGQIKARKTDKGYLLEIGFSVPGLKLKPGKVVGVELAVGDNDGASRKSLMTWTGKQVEFWITMDHFGKMTLVK